MDFLAKQLLESWDRQCKILTNLVGTLTAETLLAKPSVDGWNVAYHLHHIELCRRYWLSQVSGAAFTGSWTDPNQNLPEWQDLSLAQSGLDESAAAIHKFLETGLTLTEEQNNPYTHPVQFLQHMVWHEGWHFGLIMLALRLAGHEPAESWEEENVWGIWRTESYE